MQSGKKKSKNQLPNKDLKLCISRRCENGCHNRWRDFVVRDRRQHESLKHHFLGPIYHYINQPLKYLL